MQDNKRRTEHATHANPPRTRHRPPHASKRYKQKRRIPKDGNKLHLATLNMKTTLLLIVVLGLAAFAQAERIRGQAKKLRKDRSCTKELHGHEHDDENPDLCEKSCKPKFHLENCVCFFNKRGYCVDHKTYVRKNRKLEAAKKEAAEKETDEYKEKEKERIARENEAYWKSKEEEKKTKWKVLHNDED